VASTSTLATLAFFSVPRPASAQWIATIEQSRTRLAMARDNMLFRDEEQGENRKGAHAIQSANP